MNKHVHVHNIVFVVGDEAKPVEVRCLLARGWWILLEPRTV